MNQFLGVVASSLLALATARAGSAQLPKIHSDTPPSALIQEKMWWAKVGDHIVHAPHEDSGLSANVGNYYYTYGSHAALTEELKDSRVGGDGRLHILHLPDGPESLSQELPRMAGRRAAVAALVQLKHKDELSNAKMFPLYQLNEAYTNPLSASGQEVEKKVVDAISSQAVMAQLQELTSLGDGKDVTRSYSNEKASSNTVSYLEKQFKDMGLKVCRQNIEGGQTSVVAFLKGTQGAQQGTVTLGGHYDSRPFEGKAPGAVDNGSGSAAVVSIAKAISTLQVKPQRSIFFVAFAAEEPGLLGSQEFAKRLKEGAPTSSFLETEDSAADSSDAGLWQRVCGEDSEIEALLQDMAKSSKKRKGSQDKKHEAIIMDEIAWKSPNIASTMGSSVVNLESYDWSTHVLENCAGSSKTHNGDELTITHSGNPFGSDHMSFLDLGFQSVLTIHGDDEGYPNYHQVTDSMDKVNPELYTKIIKMNAGALLRLAGVDA